jgi:uncharacterized iron-regulated membrane protein
MSKLFTLSVFGAGYVLGARAGRERYEQIASGARKVAGNPRVQAASSRAQETIAQQAPVVAEAVKDKAASAAHTVQEKVSEKFGSDDSSTNGSAANHPASPSTSTGPMS